MHRFKQPLLHQFCDFHDLGLIQRRNKFPFWKCICHAIFLQILGQLLKNNTIHNSRDPAVIDQTVFMTEIFTGKWAFSLQSSRTSIPLFNKTYEKNILTVLAVELCIKTNCPAHFQTFVYIHFNELTF